MDKLPETLTQGASRFLHQRNDSGTFKRGQLSILLLLLIFAMQAHEDVSHVPRLRKKGRRDERAIDKAEAEIRSFTILSSCLRDRLQTGVTKEGHHELQNDGMASRN